MFLIRWACKTLLGLHLLLAVVAALTAEVDLEDKPLREFREDLVHWYEVSGFGNIYVGIALIGLVLMLPWLIPALLPSRGVRLEKKE